MGGNFQEVVSYQEEEDSPQEEMVYQEEEGNSPRARSLVWVGADPSAP